MATSGPGATNLVTGIADAFMDSVPLIAITGQVAQSMIGKSAFQETDIYGMTLPVVKHSYLVTDINDIPRIVKEAFHIAQTGRPGPILIDLPKNVQQARTQPVFPAKASVRGYCPRFEHAKCLVGYAGMGARVHDSGQLHATGRITKAGRRDIRRTMVGAAQHATRTHPHWKAELARHEPRIGKEKAIVAIGRKLLVAVWHVLTDHEADRFAEATNVACSFFAFAYKVGVKHLPDGQSALAFTRNQLDRLQIGADLQQIPWGSKTFKLPPSKLKA